MRPTSKHLALRDPAMAALLGLVGAVDFGNANSFGMEVMDDEPMQNTDFGVEFGNDYGVEFGGYGGFGVETTAAPRPIVGMPGGNVSPEMMQVWQKHQATAQSTSRRQMLLEPNKGSAIKIERYQFSANQELVLGTSETLDMSNNPDTTIRPQRLTINAPSCGFVIVSEIKVANVSVQVGGSADGFEFNAGGVGQSLDMPTLTPSNRASVKGTYTGYVPTGYVNGAAYTLCASFKGPSQIVA